MDTNRTTSSFNDLKSAAETLIADTKLWLDALKAQVETLDDSVSVKATALTNIALYRRSDNNLKSELYSFTHDESNQTSVELVSLLKNFLTFTEELYDDLQESLPTLPENEAAKATTTNAKKAASADVPSVKEKAEKVKADRTKLQKLLESRQNTALSNLLWNPLPQKFRLTALSQFKATALYANGSYQDVTNKVAWKVTGANGVGTEIAQISPTGLLTPQSEGMAQVVATCGDLNSQVDLTVLSSRALFLDQIVNFFGKNDSNYKLTKQLFNGEHLQLKDDQITNLTEAWGKVVNSFTKTAKSSSDSPTVIAQFVQIHLNLQTLYNRLTTNVTRLGAEGEILAIY